MPKPLPEALRKRVIDTFLENEQDIEHIRQAGYAVLFTPPYSPEFSKLKILVRKQCPRCAKSLRQAIDNALQ